MRPTSRSSRSTVVGLAVASAVLAGIAVPLAVTTPAEAATSAATAGTAAVTASTVRTAAVTASTVRTAAATSVYGAGQYTSPTSQPAKYAASLRTSDPAGATAAATIAKYPIATWLGEWSTGSSLTTTLQTATAGAAAAGTTAVFVTYAIPDRDCGGYSAGGMTEASYDSWIDTIVAALKGTRSAVIVEPDSLAMLSNCASDVAAQRYRILNREVAAFTAAGVASYLDAGNSNWVQPSVMAARLNAAGVANARGFFSNVANYYPVAQEQAYDEKVSALTNGAHYVIDTSRNGQGWRGTWCNGPGAGLGATPRVVADGTHLDALLWVKTPGASDGSCNGAPAAGEWYSAYAKALVANAVLQPASVPASATGGTGSVGTPVSTLDPVTPVTTATTKRIAGTNAYDTAAKVATSAFSTASTVYVASRATFPDALSAGAAAGHDGAPVLLTAPTSLPAQTAAALRTLRPSRIVVVGGTSAVSAGVVTSLSAIAPVKRLAGTTRYATSAAISRATFSAGVTTAYVAVGTNFPDALSGAAIAATAAGNGPMLLVAGSSVPAPIVTELQRLRPGRIVVLGGTSVVSSAVADQLAQYTTGAVARWSGSDRYGTSATIAAKGYPNGVASGTVYVATGTNFPDALAAAAVAGRAGSPLLLVSPSSVPASVAAEITRIAPTKVVVLGGTSAVSAAVAAAL